MARSAGRPPGSPVPEHGPVPPLGVSLYGRPWRSPCEPVPAISILHSSTPYVTAYGGQAPIPTEELIKHWRWGNCGWLHLQADDLQFLAQRILGVARRHPGIALRGQDIGDELVRGCDCLEGGGRVFIDGGTHKLDVGGILLNHLA